MFGCLVDLVLNGSFWLGLLCDCAGCVSGVACVDWFEIWVVLGYDQGSLFCSLWLIYLVYWHIFS